MDHITRHILIKQLRLCGSLCNFAPKAKGLTSKCQNQVLRHCFQFCKSKLSIKLINYFEITATKIMHPVNIMQVLTNCSSLIALTKSVCVHDFEVSFVNWNHFSHTWRIYTFTNNIHHNRRILRLNTIKHVYFSCNKSNSTWDL